MEFLGKKPQTLLIPIYSTTVIWYCYRVSVYCYLHEWCDILIVLCTHSEACHTGHPNFLSLIRRYCRWKNIRLAPIMLWKWPIMLLSNCNAQKSSLLCLKFMLQNQDYAHELTILLEHFKLSGCSVRESDSLIRIFRSFLCMQNIFNQETVINVKWSCSNVHLPIFWHAYCPFK